MLLEGIYQITPMGEHTSFECLVQPMAEGYRLIDLKTWQHLEISADLMMKMRPQYRRREALEAVWARHTGR